MSDAREQLAAHRRFTVVYELVRDPLARYFARRVRADEVDDLFAETLAVLWRRVGDIPDGGELPWSYGVASRVLSEHRRAAGRLGRLIARVTLATPPDTLVELRVGADGELGAALSALRTDDAEILRLWAWEELTPAEIAAVLGISPNAASVRLHRAKERLRSVLEPDGKDRARAGQMGSAGRKEPR